MNKDDATEQSNCFVLRYTIRRSADTYNCSLVNSFLRRMLLNLLLDTMGIREHMCDIKEGGEEAFS